MAILVTGATGNVGRNVVRRLVEAGTEVRALTRSPRPAGLPEVVRVIAGDLMQPESLADALKEVDRMYLFPVAETAREVVALARQAGVRRIVVLSSGAVTAGFDSDFHLPVERAVEESGLEWTHVRPGEFAMNKLALWGPSIRAEGWCAIPTPRRPGVRYMSRTSPMSLPLPCWRTGTADGPTPSTAPTCCRIVDRLNSSPKPSAARSASKW